MRLPWLWLVLTLAVSDIGAQESGSKAPGALEFQTLLRIATAALTDCRSHGFPVTVVIVDGEGVPQIMLRDDHAAPHTPESAERKAYTAASFGMPTAKLGELASSNADFAWLSKLEKVIFVSGGLPIRVGNTVVGGIGVAGGTGPGADQACAIAGLAHQVL